MILCEAVLDILTGKSVSCPVTIAADELRTIVRLASPRIILQQIKLKTKQQAETGSK